MFGELHTSVSNVYANFYFIHMKFYDDFITFFVSVRMYVPCPWFHVSMLWNLFASQMIYMTQILLFLPWQRKHLAYLFTGR